MAETAYNPIDGVALSYTVAGAGEPVVLVHGSALSGAIWRGFGYVRALRENYQVVTLDLRGHGRSAKPGNPADYRVDRMASDILAVLDALDAGPVHYAGYSLGGRLGFELAVSAPERLRSFTSLGGTYRIQPDSVASLFFDEYDDALAAGGMPGFVAGWEERMGTALDPATRAAFLANDAAALRAYFRQVGHEAALPESILAGIGVPTLLMAGTRDVPRLADSRRAADVMPDARFVALPDRTHGSTLVPAGPVLAELLPFLGRHGG